MTLQYDGTGYRGWQTQPGGGTVQDVVEERLARILNHPLKVNGAGRTDSGVHARGQVASFETRNPLPLDRLFRGLNTMLPHDVAAVDWSEAPPGFHARYSARRRTYTYQVWRREICPPFQHRYVHHLHRELDEDQLKRSAEQIRGEHDFTSFCAAAAAALLDSRVRHVLSSEWALEGEMLVYRIEAESFLHHMVRILVGTMLRQAAGSPALPGMRSILQAKDRTAAGPTAPARGLFLESVRYGRDAEESA